MLKSIRSLKAELSACLHRVQNGEECYVALHQQVIAKIIPVQSPLTIKQLNRERFVAGLIKNLIKPKKRNIPLSEIVIRQRQDERY